MPAPDDYIGKVIAQKYRVELMLGEGGMGKVYKATQLSLDKPVVLKVLRQALLGDDRTVKRFRREALAASRLNHPNSINVLDYGEADDGALYIAMEYVEGRDLHAILSREWPLPESRVIRIMGQVLSALADAHSAGVIHRDLKPENIMVENKRRDEPDFVKVLDFGIAKIIDGSEDDGPALTRAGFVCGTPEYMSPEQARGSKLDHRSDLYAVGVIIYQLMTGMLPFDSDSAVGFATKHLTEIPLPPTKRRPDARVSPAMERLIVRALSKNPDDRPQTAEQFRAELQAIEKERRATVGSQVRRVSSAPSLQPVTRKVTPIDQQETKISGPPSSPWSVKEDTVRAPPPAFGPVPNTVTTTAPTTSPDRLGLFSDGGSLLFKLATVLLVALALGLAGTYLWQLLSQPKEVYVPPRPAPGAGVAPLYELEVPASSRRSGDAQRFALEGDGAWHKGNHELARSAYFKAWAADPQPETALKIGELYFEDDQLADAKAWWTRFRRDAPDSKALAYIDQVLPQN